MSWEESDKTIRSGREDPQELQPDTLRPIPQNEGQGIQAIVGKPLGNTSVEIQSYLFAKDKGWKLKKAKDWFNKVHALSQRALAQGA